MFPVNTFAYDVPESHTERSNNTRYSLGWGWNDIYAAYSIGFMGAEWSPSRQAWGFNYRMAGTGSSSGPDDMIRIAAMEVEGTSNTNNMAIWTSSDSKYLGSAPTSNTSTNYSGVAEAVVGFAITAINNLGASYIWSTYSLLQALGNTVDSTSSNPDYMWREWAWSPDISNTGQFFWFIVDVEPNQTVQISTDYMIFGPGYELLQAGKSYRNLNAGSSRSINMNPEQMTAIERKQNGIETISRKDFANRASELNISERSQQEFNKSDEDVFFYAHDFIEYEVIPSPEINKSIDDTIISKNKLLDNISTQIDRSEKIIKAFSNYKISEREDSIAIVQKHLERIDSLLDLQGEVEYSNENNLDEYEIIYEQYNNIIRN